ncbi:MAG TPA: hypothetical protein DCQ98_05070 [Planctomycetaceae bacterium]|nr:hypothetical protein [Planctomycetaceae bacterium]
MPRESIRNRSIHQPLYRETDSRNIWVGAIRSLLVVWAQVPLIRATKIEIGESAVDRNAHDPFAGGRWGTCESAIGGLEVRRRCKRRTRRPTALRVSAPSSGRQSADRVHPPL